MTSVFEPTGELPWQRTLVLQASAGTGKTTAIAGLSARYVVERGVPLGDLMIATFSGASTRELRARVHAELVAVERALASTLAGGDPADHGPVARLLADVPRTDAEERLGRVRTALSEYDKATICTTHQFCDRMLTTLGVLVDHEPGTTLVDDLSGVLEQTFTDLYLTRYALTPEPPFDVRTARDIARFAAVRHPALPLAPEGDERAAARLDFARAVRTEIEARKRRLGLYTFDDMQLRLRDALIAPSTGELAREALRARFPVVLIDEFQDTDPVQWDIVRDAFVGHSTVVLIGDPKQSIYGFRGADVYAYLSAIDTAELAVLGTNHRSDPALVKAVTSLFAGAELGDPRIRVEPVAVSPRTPTLVTDGPWRAPLRLRYVEEDLPWTQAERAVNADLVADIGRLLRSNAVVHHNAETTTLSHRQVAVIVSSNRRGEVIRGLLAEAGIPAVFSGSRSVLESVAAHDWLALLTAFQNPWTRRVRALTMTDFFGWTQAELVTASDSELGLVTQQVRTWHRVAADHGIAALAECMLADGSMARRCLIRQGGDRVLTDLRHVADLLQAEQSRSGLGLAALTDWLADQVRRYAGGGDDRSRRLETDAEAVQVMTVHQAKGLQFPVVYLPDMSSVPRQPQSWRAEPIQVHLERDGQLVRVLDLGGDGVVGPRERRELYDQEQAGERLRTLYVALTRAECHVTAWWVPTKETDAASLHRILFRDVATPHVPGLIPHEGRSPALLTRLTGSGIDLQPMTPQEISPSVPPEQRLLSARPFTRVVDRGWRRTSYSALTAAAHHEALPLDLDLPDEPPDPTAALPPEELPAEPMSAPAVPDALATLSPMAHLPGGTAFGSLVHAVFETFDPADPQSLAEIVTRETVRLPVADVSASALVEALRPALATPLGPLFDGASLADVRAEDRLAELDFELPLAATEPTLPGIARLMAAHLADDDPLADYPRRLHEAGLGDDALRGFLTGSIDATIRVGERHVVVDYKTNRLSPPGVDITLGHYVPSAMAEAMMASHYPLQALLYSVALHRFLRWRLTGYRPDRHLGGIGYLFVRGMAGPRTPVVDGMPTGVFTWRPAAELVTSVSDLLAGKETR